MDKKKKETKPEYKGEIFAGIFSHLSDTTHRERYEIMVGFSRDDLYKRITKTAATAKWYKTQRVYEEINARALTILEDALSKANKEMSDRQLAEVDKIIYT